MCTILDEREIDPEEVRRELRIYDRETLRLQYCWDILRLAVYNTYRSIKTANSEHESSSRLLQSVEMLCERDPQLLYKRLEGQATKYVVEIKLRLLKKLTTSQKDARNALHFTSSLVKEYQKYIKAADQISTYLTPLELIHLKQFHITWVFLNKHLFQEIIYSENLIQNSLSVILKRLKEGCQLAPVQSAFKKAITEFVRLKKELVNVSSEWAHCQSLMSKYHAVQKNEKAKHLLLKEEFNLFNTQTELLCTEKDLENYFLCSGDVDSTSNKCSCHSCSDQVLSSKSDLANIRLFGSAHHLDIQPPSIPSTSSDEDLNDDENPPVFSRNCKHHCTNFFPNDFGTLSLEEHVSPFQRCSSINGPDPCECTMCGTNDDGDSQLFSFEKIKDFSQISKYHSSLSSFPTLKHDKQISVRKNSKADLLKPRDYLSSTYRYKIQHDISVCPFSVIEEKNLSELLKCKSEIDSLRVPFLSNSKSGHVKSVSPPPYEDSDFESCCSSEESVPTTQLSTSAKRPSSCINGIEPKNCTPLNENSSKSINHSSANHTANNNSNGSLPTKSKKSKKTNKANGERGICAIDEAFQPSQNIEALDEEEKEIEMFKQFCLQNSVKMGRPKVKLNVQDIYKKSL